MSVIRIEYDEKQQLFMMCVPPEFQPRKHNGDIWMTYEEALQLYATLRALLKNYENTYKD